MIMKKIIAMLAAAVLVTAVAGCTNKSPVTDSSTEPTASVAETAAEKPSTTMSSIIPKAPSSKPVSTAASYTPPTVEYGGTLGTAEDSIRITSHEVSLTTNNTFALKLDAEILACSGTQEYIFIGYDCYDADGNKLNKDTVKSIVPLRQGETKTLAIASAPFETVKIVFKSL